MIIMLYIVILICYGIIVYIRQRKRLKRKNDMIHSIDNLQNEIKGVDNYERKQNYNRYY
ncbi:hypothetical protein Alsa4_CDS0052 [Staphylococcus phage Alsa_4]|nr:hypothetical protein Alsa4_CDS0052 [Staphylococcus phage Alsa_4]WNM56083.1 hypothetical protein CoNPh38_CDS0207 [Staphylococcus phage S-CoN_Ph38]